MFSQIFKGFVPALLCVFAQAFLGKEISNDIDKFNRCPYLF
jgi:hypothetical protein